MKKILLIILILPLSSYAQIYKHNRVFNDSLVFKNFNQGYLDSQEYFNGTNDFLLGLVSTPIYFAPAAISFFVPPSLVLKGFPLSSLIVPKSICLYSLAGKSKYLIVSNN